MNKLLSWFSRQPGWFKVATYQVTAGLLTAATIRLANWQPSSPEIVALVAAFNMALKTIKDNIPQ